MLEPTCGAPKGSARGHSVGPPLPRRRPGTAKVLDERYAARWPSEHGDGRRSAVLQPISDELLDEPNHDPEGDSGDNAHACAGRRTARCTASTRDFLSGGACQSRPENHEAASAWMSVSHQATPRFEMRAALGYRPLFTPSYHVLRDTGMMRNTSCNFRRRPGKCRMEATFGAEPVLTAGGVEFILLVSPQTRKSRHPDCSLQVIQNREAAKITRHPYGTIRIDPAVQVACGSVVVKSIPTKRTLGISPAHVWIHGLFGPF